MLDCIKRWRILQNIFEGEENRNLEAARRNSWEYWAVKFQMNLKRRQKVRGMASVLIGGAGMTW